MTPEVVSRQTAKTKGLLHYFTGKPCLRGGVAARVTTSAQCLCDACIAVVKASERKWRQENATEKAACNARWHRKNADHVTEYKRRHLSENQARYAWSRKVWNAENRQSRLASAHLRRARKMNATPCWYGELDDFTAREAADLCRLRAAATGFAWHVDHMVPLQAREACGLHCATNLQVIPAAVNIAKKNKMNLTEPGEWVRHV